MPVLHHHHLTLCVGSAIEDHGFHTKVLGLRNIKKTLLYDGGIPIYHLYYGNDDGDESTLLTSFAVGHLDCKARPGTGQFSSVSLSVPEDSLDWWETRLREHGLEVRRGERFGEPRLTTRHPCGIAYHLAGVESDARPGATAGGVPSDAAIRGVHEVTVAVRDLENQQEFMERGWGARETDRERDFVRYAVGRGGPGALVDLHVQPDVRQGSWTFAEGSVHHCAFKVPDADAQTEIKGHLEGMGFTDVSDVKDRGYFHSVYVRSPSGALFEATVSKPEGFLIDEPADTLGTQVMIAPQFADRKAEILAGMETLPE